MNEQQAGTPESELARRYGVIENTIHRWTANWGRMEIDDCTRECVMEILEFLISGQRLSRKLGRLSRPSSATRVCDNGPECTFRALFIWAKEPAVRLNFIQPGKPTWVRRGRAHSGS